MKNTLLPKSKNHKRGIVRRTGIISKVISQWSIVYIIRPPIPNEKTPQPKIELPSVLQINKCSKKQIKTTKHVRAVELKVLFSSPCLTFLDNQTQIEQFTWTIRSRGERVSPSGGASISILNRNRSQSAQQESMKQFNTVYINKTYRYDKYVWWWWYRNSRETLVFLIFEFAFIRDPPFSL